MFDRIFGDFSFEQFLHVYFFEQFLHVSFFEPFLHALFQFPLFGMCERFCCFVHLLKIAIQAVALCNVKASAIGTRFSSRSFRSWRVRNCVTEIAE